MARHAQLCHASFEKYVTEPVAPRIAEFLEIPIQRCRELIAEGNLPTFQMPGATTRCARKSALNAHWQALEEAAKAA